MFGVPMSLLSDALGACKVLTLDCGGRGGFSMLARRMEIEKSLALTMQYIEPCVNHIVNEGTESRKVDHCTVLPTFPFIADNPTVQAKNNQQGLLYKTKARNNRT